VAIKETARVRFKKSLRKILQIVPVKLLWQKTGLYGRSKYVPSPIDWLQGLGLD
jgi:hypothetical protein